MGQLSPDELARMADTKQGAAQLRYFRRLGLHVFADGSGHPVVTWEAINAVLLGRNKTEAEPELNLAAAFGKVARR